MTYADTFRTQNVDLTRNQLKALRAKARRHGLYASETGEVVPGTELFHEVLSVVANVAA